MLGAQLEREREKNVLAGTVREREKCVNVCS